MAGFQNKYYQYPKSANTPRRNPAQNNNFNQKIRFEPAHNKAEEPAPPPPVPKQKESEVPENPPHNQGEENKSTSQNISNSNNILQGLLNNLFPDKKGKIDADTVIIVILLIVLAREKVDIKLLLALGYLLI